MSVGDGRGRGREPGSSHWGGGLRGSGLGSHLKVWLDEEALWRPRVLAAQTSAQGFVSSDASAGCPENERSKKEKATSLL